MGYIPHVVMPTFKEGHTPTKYLIKDQVAPEHFWGLIHQGTRPRINPCPRHGYPGPCPEALDISRDFNCLVPDQEPQSYTGGPLKGLYCLVPDQEPQSLLGALTRVFCCLVPDQEPQSSTGGPYKGLLLLGPRPRTPVIYWGPLQGSFAMALTVWSQTKNPRSALGALDFG
jgi:hypothetical protein